MSVGAHKGQTTACAVVYPGTSQGAARWRKGGCGDGRGGAGGGQAAPPGEPVQEVPVREDAEDGDEGHLHDEPEGERVEVRVARREPLEEPRDRKAPEDVHGSVQRPLQGGELEGLRPRLDPEGEEQVQEGGREDQAGGEGPPAPRGDCVEARDGPGG